MFQKGLGFRGFGTRVEGCWGVPKDRVLLWGPHNIPIMRVIVHWRESPYLEIWGNYHVGLGLWQQGGFLQCHRGRAVRASFSEVFDIRLRV